MFMAFTSEKHDQKNEKLKNAVKPLKLDKIEQLEAWDLARKMRLVVGSPEKK